MAKRAEVEAESVRRETVADERDRAADVREHRADARETAADHRDQAADEREHRADARETAADHRDQAADERDWRADHREHAADKRDQALDERAEGTKPSPRVQAQRSREAIRRSLDRLASSSATLQRRKRRPRAPTRLPAANEASSGGADDSRPTR